MLNARSLTVIAVLLVCAAVAQAGPSGRYYVTDESGINNIWQFQGDTLTTFPTFEGARSGPIIVDGLTETVKAIRGGFGGGAIVSGSEYEYDGTRIGDLELDFSAHPANGRVIDAGFDGTNTYIVAWSGGVYRYGADFSGPGTLLFSLPSGAAASAQGITYDTTTDTIWTSDYDFGATATGGKVRQWSLDGEELFSFNVVDAAGVPSERNTALAYDFSDDTFWMNAHVERTLGFGNGELWQFDREGNFLQKIHGAQLDPNAPSSILYWGGEIRATGEPAIPEPSTFALFGLAAVAGVCYVRRRRKTS